MTEKKAFKPGWDSRRPQKDIRQDEQRKDNEASRVGGSRGRGRL